MRWGHLRSVLDDYSAFRRIYEVPILRGRAPGASTREVEVGKLRSAQVILYFDFTLAVTHVQSSSMPSLKVSSFDAI